MNSLVRKYKYEIMVCIILIIGFFVRIYGISEHPNGLNVDEASIGYEAYSIMNYGIDRNGKTYPVFLEAWGSGQNALYAYLIMPFIKVFGLSTFSVRFPIAIVGCISLIVLYKLLKIIENKKMTLCVLFIFSISPWYIMKSRFGLESNILPDIILWSVYFFSKFLKYDKKENFYIGSAFLGIASYAYGISYFVIPVFFIMFIALLLKKKRIKLLEAFIGLGIIFVIALPIILMIFINSFNLNEIKIGFITIPRMQSNRYETLTLLSKGSILKTMISNFSESMKILLTGDDKLLSNAIFPYGIIYIFSIPLTIIGLFLSFKRKNEINIMMNIWFLTSILLTFIVEPNINRINVLWIPVIYYTAIGVYEIIENVKVLGYILVVMYLIAFISFENTYFKTDFTNNYTFYDGIESVIKYTNEIEAEEIYFEYAFKEPYIYVLFYNKINPRYFNATVKYKNNIKSFDSVKSFGKYIFSLPKKLDNTKDVAYILKKKEEKNYNIDEDLWKKTYIDDFLVLEKRIKEDLH